MKDLDLIISRINSYNNSQMLIDILYSDKLELKQKKYILYNVDDNIKIDVLDFTLENFYKKLIISCLHEDSEKIKHLYLIDDYDKFEIISKFIYDEDKIKSIKYLNDNYWKDLILYSLKNEDIRKKSISLMKNDIVKSNLINEFDIENKLLNLNYINNINIKRGILLNILEEKDLYNIYKLDDEYLNIISNVYSINKNILIKLINRFSVEVLLYLDNNLKGLLEYTEEEINKFLSLFDKSNFMISREEVENICFSLEYYRYQINSEDTYNKFLMYLETGNSKKFMEEYNKVLEFLNTEEIYKIIKYNELKINDIKYLTFNLFNKNNFIRNLNILKIIINIYNDKKRSKYIQSNIELIENNVKSIRNADIKDTIEIITNIDYKEFSKNIILNDEYYNKLLKILYKYKYLGLTNDISKLFELVNLNFNNEIKRNIIEKFSDYYNYLENSKDDNEFIDIVYMASGYEESNYNKYLLLGKNNYLKNRNKNKSLKDLKNNIISLYNRKTCLVPSFSFEESINDISLEIEVGKYFDKINYLDIFKDNEFCILFKNIYDNNVIAKVKGYREGRAVFLNDIEIILKTNLVLNDFIYLCEKASERVIAESNNAKDNIESVFISAYNYVSRTDEQLIYYMDSKYVLLYGKSLITISTTSDYKKYDVIRSKIQLYKDLDASDCEYEFKLINMVTSDNKNDISFNNDIAYLYCGEDWYIKKTKDDKLSEFILDISKNNKITMEEKNICMEILKNEN